MRFSLKWTIAGIAYVALAAVGLAMPHWGYSDVLWVLAFLAIVHALILAIFAHGPRQSVATGFAMASVLLAGLSHVSPESLPTTRLFSGQASNPSPPVQQIQAYTVMVPGKNGTFVPEQRQRVMNIAPTPLAVSPFLPNHTAVEGPLLRLRAANAVATMLAGLVGGVLGAVAWRREPR